MIFLGADHRGFELKGRLLKRLQDEGFEATDLGNDHLDLYDDYIDFAHKVAQATISDPKNRGLLICGSGIGMDIVANKISGIRSALVYDVVRAKQAREHNDANVLSLPADVLDEEKAWEIIKTFLETPFSGEERHVRRLKKLQAVEEENNG